MGPGSGEKAHLQHATVISSSASYKETAELLRDSRKTGQCTDRNVIILAVASFFFSFMETIFDKDMFTCSHRADS